MDIIQRLQSLPVECRREILLFAFKSPHTDLGVGLLKNKLKDYYLNIPDNDKDVILFDKDTISFDSHDHIYISKIIDIKF